MRIGYARVSTTDQTLALQRDALKEAGCAKVFTDRGVSGTMTSRPGLDRALRALKPGDTLIVWKLDRLGRLGSADLCSIPFRVQQRQSPPTLCPRRATQRARHTHPESTSLNAPASLCAGIFLHPAH
jgi:hypothetical protein